MKKLLAIILCAVVMLSACAFTAGPDGSSYSLSGITVNAAGQSIDMSDITIGVDIAGGEDDGSLILYVDQGGEPLVEVGFTTVDNLYIMHLQSPTLGHKDYAIDPVIELANSLDTIRNWVVNALQNVDTTQAAQQILELADVMSEAVEEAAEAPEATEEPAAGLNVNIDFSVIGNPMELLEECINEPETVTLTGEVLPCITGDIEIPDGEYVHNSFDVDKEHTIQFMNMFTINGESIYPVDEMQAEDLDVQIAGDLYENDTTMFGFVGVAASDDLNANASGLWYMGTTEETGKHISFVIGSREDDALTDVTFSVDASAPQRGAFGPDSIDMDNIINISEGGDDVKAEYQQDMMTILGETIGVIYAPFIEMATEAMQAAMPAEDAAEVPAE